MAQNWAERISAFSRSPSRFLSGTTAEAFLAELLRELRDDRASYSVKVKTKVEIDFMIEKAVALTACCTMAGIHCLHQLAASS